MINKLLYINIILAVVLNWLTKNPNFSIYGFSYLNILPKAAFGIVELISIIIFFLTILELRKKKEFVYPLLLIGGFLLFYYPYSIYWGGATTNFILGVRNYFSFLPILFGGYYLALKGESIKPFVILILILALIQLPVTIFQYNYSFALLKRGTVYDVVAGTMGGLASNLMAILLSSTVIVLFNFYLKYKKKWIIVAIIGLIIPCVIAEAKGVFILVALGFGYLFFAGRITLNKKVIVALYGVGFFLVLIFTYNSFVDLDRNVWDYEYYIEYENNKLRQVDARLPRHISVINAVEVINENPPGLFLGLGLGNASINNFIGGDGPFYSNITIVHFWDRFITEVGMVWTLLFIVGLVRISVICRYVEKKTKDPFISALAGGVAGVILISIFAGLYTDHYNRIQFSYPLSLVVGYLLGVYNQSKNNKYKIKVRGKNNLYHME